MQPYKNLSIIVQKKAEMINKTALRFTALSSVQMYFPQSKPYRKKPGRSERSYGTHFRCAERERRHIKHFAVRFCIASLLATAIVFQSAPVKLKKNAHPFFAAVATACGRNSSCRASCAKGTNEGNILNLFENAVREQVY